MLRRVFAIIVSFLTLTLVSLSSVSPATATSNSSLQSYGDSDQWASEVNQATGLVTVPHSGVTSDVGYAEGGGYDDSTGKTWILGDSCHLFTLDTATGIATERYDLRNLIITNGNLPLQWCMGFAIDGNDMALITAWVWDESDPNNVVMAGAYLFRINLATGALIRSAPIPLPAGQSRSLFAVAVDPYGDVWAAITETKELVKIDEYTGNISVQAVLAHSVWDMAFDSQGLLWVNVDTPNYSLATVDVNAANISASEHVVADFHTANGSLFNNEAIWFGPEYTPVAAQGGGSSTEGLANTGTSLAWLAALALTAILSGVGLYSIRAQRRGRC